MGIPNASPPRVLVMGCGGIGGVLMSHLLGSGIPVSCVAHREAIADVLKSKGVRLRSASGEHTFRDGLEVFVQAPASLEEAGGAPFDFVFLATPPNGAEAAARAVFPLLGSDGALVCFQNGLGEERVSGIVPAARVLGAVVAFRASTPEPGVYERTSSGGLTLGALENSPENDARLERLESLLSGIGPMRRTRNLRGARWTKLGLNCVVSSLGTLGGDRLGPLLARTFVRRLSLDILSEVVDVAHANGVRLEPVIPGIRIEVLRLGSGQRQGDSVDPSLWWKHAVMLTLGARFRRLRSSMLAALERGREPPIDFLNGEIVMRAAQVRLGSPVNARIVAGVKALARGEAKPSLPWLRGVYDATRVRVAS